MGCHSRWRVRWKIGGGAEVGVGGGAVVIWVSSSRNCWVERRSRCWLGAESCVGIRTLRMDMCGVGFVL